jgi:hypothetical protein
MIVYLVISVWKGVLNEVKPFTRYQEAQDYIRVCKTANDPDEDFTLTEIDLPNTE